MKGTVGGLGPHSKVWAHGPQMQCQMVAMCNVYARHFTTLCLAFQFQYLYSPGNDRETTKSDVKKKQD